MKNAYKDLYNQFVNENQYLIYNMNSFTLFTDLGGIMLPPYNILYSGDQIHFHYPSEH